ncbi:proline-rich receptor-like protein kinase PERK9 [Iris pallida]|uniref:Proline-rich receptor-like protein kinase PERK9 n=1 Tax=Iris pallida TaxID=29817 RepID=A0AAX6IL28_IRIPA|nr:proline-rich receptor-like protein kinase PERK9 [Iris pallida]
MCASTFSSPPDPSEPSFALRQPFLAFRRSDQTRRSAGTTPPANPSLFGLFWTHWDCPCRRLGPSVEHSSVPTSCQHVRVVHVNSNQSRRIAGGCLLA